MYITKENLKHIKLDKKSIRNAKRMCKFIRKEMKRNRSMINTVFQEMNDYECHAFIETMIKSLAKTYNNQSSQEYVYYDYDVAGEVLKFNTFISLI